MNPDMNNNSFRIYLPSGILTEPCFQKIVIQMQTRLPKGCINPHTNQHLHFFRSMSSTTFCPHWALWLLFCSSIMNGCEVCWKNKQTYRRQPCVLGMWKRIQSRAILYHLTKNLFKTASVFKKNNIHKNKINSTEVGYCRGCLGEYNSSIAFP